MCHTRSNHQPSYSSTGAASAAYGLLHKKTHSAQTNLQELRIASHRLRDAWFVALAKLHKHCGGVLFRCQSVSVLRPPRAVRRSSRWRPRLLTQPEPGDDGFITLRIGSGQVPQQARPAPHHFQQTPTGRMVLQILLKVLGQFLYACRKQRDLNLGEPVSCGGSGNFRSILSSPLPSSPSLQTNPSRPHFPQRTITSYNSGTYVPFFPAIAFSMPGLYTLAFHNARRASGFCHFGRDRTFGNVN